MIRKAEVKDLEYIVNLWQQMSEMHESLDSAFKLKKGAVEHFRPYAKTVIADKEKFSIVFDETEVAGYLFAEVLVQPPVYSIEKTGIISEICVDKAQRRNGVGVKLLRAAEEWFMEQGITVIDCQVAVKNPVSNYFWSKNGYMGYSKMCRKNF